MRTEFEKVVPMLKAIGKVLGVEPKEVGDSYVELVSDKINVVLSVPLEGITDKVPCEGRRYLAGTMLDAIEFVSMEGEGDFGNITRCITLTSSGEAIGTDRARIHVYEMGRPVSSEESVGIDADAIKILRIVMKRLAPKNVVVDSDASNVSMHVLSVAERLHVSIVQEKICPVMPPYNLHIGAKRSCLYTIETAALLAMARSVTAAPGRSTPYIRIGSIDVKSIGVDAYLANSKKERVGEGVGEVPLNAVATIGRGKPVPVAYVTLPALQVQDVLEQFGPQTRIEFGGKESPAVIFRNPTDERQVAILAPVA